MNRYPHTTAGSILLLAAAIMFTGAGFVKYPYEMPLLTMALLFALGGLVLMWSRESQ